MFKNPRHRERIAYWESLQITELWPLLIGVFLLFSGVGFLTDVFQLGRLPFVLVAVWAVFTGALGVAYVVVLARRRKAMPLVFVAQVVITLGLTYLTVYISDRSLFPHPSVDVGVTVATGCALAVMMASYGFFLAFIQKSGAKAIRAQAEIAVAHRVQERLVPPINLLTPRFEVYGQTRPSEKVGGDLVGWVETPGATYAYIADVSGHGMQSALLMNMLTTCIRTALLDSPSLSRMLQRVNTVLPAVKEPQMYTTFAGFRFGPGDDVELALCGHPPILWFRKVTREVTELGQPEFAIGMFPAVDFSTLPIHPEPGDMYVLLTDGILEATDATGQEFGVQRVTALLKEGADAGAHALAQRIFSAVDSFGAQHDDQTILLIRVRQHV